MKIPALIGVVLTMLIVIAAASAAKPGQATLVSSCNPCAAGATVTLSGSGYEPGYVGIQIIGDAGMQVYAPSGSFSFDLSLAGLALGSWEFVAYQNHGANGGQYVQARITIQVE